MADPDDPLADYPAVIELPVEWGYQDLFGHVNNVVYFRWYESARIAYFEQFGFFKRSGLPQVGLILASIKSDYRRPLNYPDTVRIGARVTRIGRTSIGVQHMVFSQAQAAVAAEGESTVVVFDYENNRPHPVPDEVRQAIAQLEGQNFSL